VIIWVLHQLNREYIIDELLDNSDDDELSKDLTSDEDLLVEE
jgi:hypothetical protein